ncbi:hypothetical protein [Streptomyces sp. NPDC001774]
MTVLAELVHEAGDPLRRRLPADEIGDHVNGLAGSFPGLEAGAVPGDPRDLGDVREIQVIDGEQLDDTGFPAAVVAAVVELCGRPLPGQRT